ncbi:hypothetical protein PV10_03377 [Exophiala mesophila]|uniref:Zn(2)-C6 fungal-type domain-containing protein n=1 Tax=Exophiala mesophila TaxID=212818 RepID=A0A0D1ZM64_EXOME|nr:uncharacterized protein PV10_03377 [Exophiala mesophila]KIV95762.1 hypothetical protein PV10_03377 [Exophiala mesophila]
MSSPISVRKIGSKRNRQPIKHTKTFSGCWTCRERHVKCDETKPLCTRCSRGGFECQGYGIKLVWVDPNTQEREQNIRRAIGAPAIYDKTSMFMSIDVQDALDELEAISQFTSPDKALGPFSVFSTTFSATNQGYIAASHSTSHTSSTESKKGTSANDQDVDEVVSQPSPDLTLVSTASSRRRRRSRITTLDLLPTNSVNRQLIYHWTNFVCWHLVPIDQPSNPFRSVFTPMALAGLSNPQSNPALFHALCATSAYSRSQLLDNDAEILTLANQHYHRSIKYLRRSLNALTPNSPAFDRTFILATITMFSAMDMITGRFAEWRTHLMGGSRLLSTLSPDTWTSSRSSSLVYQGYLAVAALCNITLPANLSLIATDSPGSGSISPDDPLSGNSYMLDRFFGLTRPILRRIVEMNSLIDRVPSTASDILSVISPAELLALESELYAQTPDTLDLSDLTPRAATLTLHHAYTFYYASLIYFLRSVRRLPPSHPKIQSLVSKAVTYFEAIELIGGEQVGCSLVWPPLVVACECITPDMQLRMTEWYKVKRRHGFRNLEMSKEIANEVWRRRDKQRWSFELGGDDDGDFGVQQQHPPGIETDIQWQDVLKELGMDIVLA